MHCLFRTLFACHLLASLAIGEVVINEIFYNAPDDLDRLEFVELANTGSDVMTLDGWKLSGEVSFKFPENTRLGPGAFLVVAKDAKLLREFYGVNARGEFKKSLSNRGGKLTLSDAQDQVVDSVRYEDSAPWPIAADGYSASLERISVKDSGAIVSNWAPSQLSTDDGNKPNGTPGARNSVAADVAPPLLRHVEWSPRNPSVGERITVTVTPEDIEQIRTAAVVYRIVAPGESGAEQRVELERHKEQLVATLPAGTERNRLLRFHIEATSTAGGQLHHPHPNEIRPAFTAYVASELKPAAIPLVQFFFVDHESHTAGEQYRDEQTNGGLGGFRGDFGGPRRGFGGPPRGFRGGPPRGFRGGGFGRRDFGGEDAFAARGLPPQGNAAVIYTDPKTGDVEVFDFVNVTRRKSGWKARLHKDQLLLGMNTVNFLFEPDERTVLNEVLAYDLYELAGNKTPQHGFMRLAVNGQPVGFHLFFEQPNGNFFSRNEINNNGDLYKLIWMGNAEMSPRVPELDRRRRPDITGRYEKKSNRHESSEDLIALIEALENAKTNDETWQLIEKHFEIDQVINYFAVNSLISHWDGFFNNYFAYFDRKGTGKWSLYPWDQDSTWSQRGGDPHELYEMPIFFGAEGATPEGLVKLTEAERAFNRNRGGFGPPGRGFGGRRGRGFGWWRAGGDFSRPLLANPKFYDRYRKRLDELTETVFTVDRLGPRIDELHPLLEAEFRLRAELNKSDPDAAVEHLDRIIGDLREHLLERRAFVRAELKP